MSSGNPQNHEDTYAEEKKQLAIDMKEHKKHPNEGLKELDDEYRPFVDDAVFDEFRKHQLHVASEMFVKAVQASPAVFAELLKSAGLPADTEFNQMTSKMFRTAYNRLHTPEVAFQRGEVMLARKAKFSKKQATFDRILEELHLFADDIKAVLGPSSNAMETTAADLRDLFSVILAHEDNKRELVTMKIERPSEHNVMHAARVMMALKHHSYRLPSALRAPYNKLFVKITEQLDPFIGTL
jgi:hypothetical protein